MRSVNSKLWLLNNITGEDYGILWTEKRFKCNFSISLKIGALIYYVLIENSMILMWSRHKYTYTQGFYNGLEFGSANHILEQFYEISFTRFS